MMMDTLLKNVKTLIDNIVVKFDSEAKRKDTLDMRKDADEYIAVMIGVDSFDHYANFDPEVLISAGLMDIVSEEDEIYEYAGNPKLIPLEYRDAVLKYQREYIAANYIEPNNYYRRYAGLPNVEDDESDFILLTNEQKAQTGITNDSYIHELSDDDIYRLEEFKILEKIIEENPDKEYLKFLGVNKIPIYQARMANNFEIIKIDNDNVPDEFFNSFIRIYNQNREYFTTTLYNKDFATRYDIYDRFMGLCIMFMTIQRLVSNAFKFGIKRDFYDWEFIRRMYESYRVPFVETLPIEYQVLVLRNINNLLRHKSTDKVLFDLCSLLGFERVSIFKYYLVKEHKLDENEKPLFYYKHATDGNGNLMYDENNNPIYVEDFEKMYNLYFQSVDIREKNIVLALSSKSKKIDYHEMVNNDAYWWEDPDLQKIKYETTYNYIQTKYLGMNIMYKMTRMLFEITYFLRAVIDNKQYAQQINVLLPKISETEFNLFDTIIFLVAATCRLNGFKDSTITSPSKISHVYGFDFNEETIEYIKKIVTDNADIVDKEIFKYFENLSVVGPEDVNRLYLKLRNYNDFIIDKMRNAKTAKEYHLYKDIFKISIVTEVENSKFTISDYDEDGNPINSRIASTYLEYLQYNQPMFASIIEEYEDNALSQLIDHVINRIELLTPDLQYLFIINDNNNPVYASLIQLLKFFKSYTVDLNSFTVVYVFDSPYYNMAKLIGDIKHMESHLYVNKEYTNFYVDNIHCTDNGIAITDPIKFNDIYGRVINFDISDEVALADRLVKTHGDITHKEAIDLIFKIRDYYKYNLITMDMNIDDKLNFILNTDKEDILNITEKFDKESIMFIVDGVETLYYSDTNSLTHSEINHRERVKLREELKIMYT